MSEWIPVKERLPKEGSPCLVTIILDSEPFVRIAYYVGKAVVTAGWLLEYGDDGGDVTAWMPYPEPYEEIKP